MSWHSAWTTSYWSLGSFDSQYVMENATEVYNALHAAGWTHNAACAVIGNLIHESSGCNPGQFEGGYNYSWSRGFGIAQWTPGTKVSDYIGSQQQGVVDDGAAQVQMLISQPGQYSTYFLNPDGTSRYYNLSGLPYIDSMAAFSQSNDSVYSLTMIWAICWERPAAQYADFGARYQYASYYDTLFGGTTPGYHKVLVISSGNGLAYATPSMAPAGTLIDLTEVPGAGEQFLFWIVNIGAVTIQNDQFIMPNEDVTITANFTGYAPEPSKKAILFPIWLYWKWQDLRRWNLGR